MKTRRHAPSRTDARHCRGRAFPDLQALVRTIFLLAFGIFPTASHADVMEVSASGAVWVSGGPVVSAVPSVSPAAESVRGIETVVSASAGPADWRGLVGELAAKYDISAALLEAVVWQESRWDPRARSSAGARGLAQLMPGTARALGVDADDPRANLEGGARYLRMQLDAFDGDLEKALAAYNAGPARVIDAGGIPNIRETRNYVAAILARLSNPVRR